MQFRETALFVSKGKFNILKNLFDRRGPEGEDKISKTRLYQVAFFEVIVQPLLVQTLFIALIIYFFPFLAHCFQSSQHQSTITQIQSRHLNKKNELAISDGPSPILFKITL